MTKMYSLPSRIDFERIDMNEIRRILKTGDMSTLTEEERDYFHLMDAVRGWRARTLSPDGTKVVTKAGIIKVLKNLYNISDFMARRIYSDAIDFFYGDADATPAAWRNLYAEKAENMANLSISSGDSKQALSFLKLAAELRGCFKEQHDEIPRELLDRKPLVVYSADAAALGAPKTDRAEIEAFIDSIPDTPEATRKRLKQDAGIESRNLLQRLIEDGKDFTEEGD